MTCLWGSIGSNGWGCAARSRTRVGRLLKGRRVAKSLLEQLPGIVAAGKRQAAQILEQLEGRNRVTLQTRELVIPSKDTASTDLFTQAARAEGGSPAPGDELNRLIYGDNLLAMAALLAGDEDTPSLRGKVNLIYIDPPYDSKADYRTSPGLSRVGRRRAGSSRAPWRPRPGTRAVRPRRKPAAGAGRADRCRHPHRQPKHSFGLWATMSNFRRDQGLPRLRECPFTQLPRMLRSSMAGLGSPPLKRSSTPR